MIQVNILATTNEDQLSQKQARYSVASCNNQVVSIPALSYSGAYSTLSKKWCHSTPIRTSLHLLEYIDLKSAVIVQFSSVVSAQVCEDFSFFQTFLEYLSNESLCGYQLHVSHDQILKN